MDALSRFHPLIARWFLEQIGEPTEVQGQSWQHISGGEHVLITAPTGSGKTFAAFTVDNVESSMRELRSKGIQFEEYDQPNIKTVNGLFSMDGMKVAWFKDTEGNTIAISNS